MMIEKHYDEEVLISFLEEGATPAGDPHLQSCSTCAAALHSFRDIAGALKDDSVWDTRTPADEPPPTIAPTLRTFAEQMAKDDAAAEGYVAQLLAGPRETWAARLSQNPQWRTAGVVRKLVEANVDAIKRNPLDALELTQIATDIADSLHASSLAANDVFRLRGGAWRERGYTLYYTGSHNLALAAIERAERYFTHVVVSEFDLARVNLVRAMILNELEHCTEASAVAYNSALTFREFGDTERYWTAMIQAGVVEMKRRAYRDALRIFGLLEREAVDTVSMAAGALFQNIACCHRELRDYGSAQRYFSRAIAAFERQGHFPARLKARWSFGRMLLAQGQTTQALELLTALRGECEELGTRHDYALMSIDIAEILLVMDRPSQVAATCAGVMAYFQMAGLEQTQAALTAVAYLHEAAAAGQLTRATVSYVRDYIEKLATTPLLAFAPPQ